MPFTRVLLDQVLHAVRTPLGVLLGVLTVSQASAQTQSINAMRDDQLQRLKEYVLEAIQPSGMVRDSLVLNPAGSHFHPASPDAAGFALVALASFDHLGLMSDADQRVVDILSAHTGNTPGVTPERSADGHFYHWLDLSNGAQHSSWVDGYSPISSALLTAGAQFARNHFSGTSSPLASQIQSLTQELTESIDFDAAIHPSLDGGVYLKMAESGGGLGGVTRPWNEYQLVTSLALRQEENDRAVAVRRLWLNPETAPKKFFGPIGTITNPNDSFAPAFWVQQANYFNGDFRHNDLYQVYFQNQADADRLYSQAILGEEYRYGFTAGVTPTGYHADRLYDHPGTVFSPSAVAPWGDLDALLQFYMDQPPGSDPRYRYGMARVSGDQPGWIPNDAGLVDHLFLLFGLVESLHPDFYAERVFAPLLSGDYNFDGSVDAADYTVWRDTQGSTTDLRADGDLDGQIDQDDYDLWFDHYSPGEPAVSESSAAPEPSAVALMLLALSGTWRCGRCRRA